MTDNMESHGGGNQLCKGIPRALIQQECCPESALWYKWSSLISGQKELSSEMPPLTELDGGQLHLGQEPCRERETAKQGTKSLDMGALSLSLPNLSS